MNRKPAPWPGILNIRRYPVNEVFTVLSGRLHVTKEDVGSETVKAEITLAVTAYNLFRAINVMGVRELCQAWREAP